MQSRIPFIRRESLGAHRDNSGPSSVSDSARDYLNVVGSLSGPNGERSRRFLMTGGSFSRT